jgi:sporulation protein YlmC with PRC-barrel domain
MNKTTISGRRNLEGAVSNWEQRDPAKTQPSKAARSSLSSEQIMMEVKAIVMAALIGAVGFTEAKAECEIADAKLEEAILQNPRLRGPANSQSVRDLRSLRDAAFTLRSYGRHEDCERLLANIRELIAGPPMGSLGDNDEEEADKQNAAREPKIRRGSAAGSRDKRDAKPLVRIDELAPGLRTDEMIGAEVRSSDDKIVGEVRNIVFGTKDGRDYAIVASGGFFTAGKDSIVVPIRSLKVSQDRASFFLPISKEIMKTVPLMPDQDYKWLSDQKWRTHNDALFQGR